MNIVQIYNREKKQNYKTMLFFETSLGYLVLLKDAVKLSNLFNIPVRKIWTDEGNVEYIVLTETSFVSILNKMDFEIQITNTEDENIENDFIENIKHSAVPC